MMNNIVSYIGNIDILKEHKTAFFCSHKCPADIIIKSYDWAVKMRDENKCVISSFHTKIEQDVFNFLKKGTQPIIKVPATNPNNVYYGDFTNTVALVITNDALVTVSFVHPTVEAKWFLEYLGTLLTIRVSQGMGFLRPECAVEISSNSANTEEQTGG